MHTNKERAPRNEFGENGEYKISEVLEGHKSWVESVIELKDDTLASSSGDGTVRMWERGKKEPLGVLSGHKGAVSEIIELRDMGTANLVSIGAYDKNAIVWNLYFGRKELVYDKHNGSINSVIQLSNRKVVTGGVGEVRIWNVKDGMFDESFRVSGEATSLLEWSQRELMVGKDDGSIVLRDVKYDHKYNKYSWNGHGGGVKSLIRLDNGNLVSCSDDGSIKVWKLEYNIFGMKEKCKMTFLGHTQAVEAIDQLPDGKIVSGSFDGSVKIWDVNSGECLQTLKSKGRGAYDVRVLRDGKIVSGHDDGKIRIWSNE